MPVRVNQVKCPKCGKPSYSKTSDNLFLCDCGTLHTIENGKSKIVYYEIAAFRQILPGTPLYIPFWRLGSMVTIHSEHVEGASVFKLREMLTEKTSEKGGFLYIFVPGIEMDPIKYKNWAAYFTCNPPKYDLASKFEAQRVPCIIDEPSAKKLADFLILSFEAEKPGVLQHIDYDVQIRDVKLIYLPFYWNNADYVPAL